MKRKLYLVDYKENGQDKHKSMECAGTGCVTDSEMVQMIHFYIGKHSRLSNIVEFITDLPLGEFDRVCDTSYIFTIPYRVLYTDMKEVEKVREMMGK